LSPGVRRLSSAGAGARSPAPGALFAALLVFIAACRAAPNPPAPAWPTPPTGTTALDSRSPDADVFLDDLERQTFRWFWDLADPETHLVPDRAPTRSFSSVAAVGFGLTAYMIGAERAWVPRSQAAERAALTLEFLVAAPQGDARAGTIGHRGLFYHFLDMKTGRRFEEVELSTIDTALLAAGALSCQSYFDRDDPVERRVRDAAARLYRRIEWDWASPRPPGIAMGWTPEDGFHEMNWRGYDESMILFVLALGSPTHPVSPAAWTEFTKTYRWGEYYGQAHVNFSPLFGHQYSHVWIDFRGIRDAYMREKGIDYFENSLRGTLSQRAYAVANPGGWTAYGADAWGLTACDGPLDATLVVAGRKREFHSYWPRGASLLYVNDDGTLAPTAAASSIPFAPEIAIPAVRSMAARWGAYLRNDYGFLDAFNPTLTDPSVPVRYGKIVPGVGGFDGDQLGIDQGPIVAMIENYRSELVWKTMRRNPHVVAGLRRAGFTGGWLDGAPR